MVWDGLKRNTPELKQSGQPMSGAAAKSTSLVCQPVHMLVSRLGFRKEKTTGQIPNKERVNFSRESISCWFVKSFLPVKQVIDVLQYQGVCVQEHTLFILHEVEDVDFGEGDAEFGALQQFEVLRVVAVKLIHFHHKVEYIHQLEPEREM